MLVILDDLQQAARQASLIRVCFHLANRRRHSFSLAHRRHEQQQQQQAKTNRRRQRQRRRRETTDRVRERGAEARVEAAQGRRVVAPSAHEMRIAVFFFGRLKALLSLEKEKISPFSRALQIPRSYDFRSRSSCSSSFLGHRRAGLGLGGKVLLLRLDSQVGQVSLGSDLDVVRRLLVEGAVHIARGQFFRTSRLVREREGEGQRPTHPRYLSLRIRGLSASWNNNLSSAACLANSRCFSFRSRYLSASGAKLCEMYRVRYGGTVPTFSSTLSTSSEGEGTLSDESARRRYRKTPTAASDRVRQNGALKPGGGGGSLSVYWMCDRDHKAPAHPLAGRLRPSRQQQHQRAPLSKRTCAPRAGEPARASGQQSLLVVRGESRLRAASSSSSS
jgi:hypothetical protein